VQIYPFARLPKSGFFSLKIVKILVSKSASTLDFARGGPGLVESFPKPAPALGMAPNGTINQPTKKEAESAAKPGMAVNGVLRKVAEPATKKFER